MALCGLAKDALEVESDATPLLKRVLQELSNTTSGGMIPSELLEDPNHVEALRRGGFMAN